MKHLIISAGGRSSRIRELLNDFNPRMDIPKHILPLVGFGTTLLGNILNCASGFFDSFEISVGPGQKFFEGAFTLNSGVQITEDFFHTGPLGPQVRCLLDNQERVFGCAGDFFLDFSWENFLEFHESHSGPVSIIIARSFPTTKGACFYLEGGKVIGWERVSKTQSPDFINIGVYIMDPVPNLLLVLARLKCHKEDNFFDILIPKGMIYAYAPEVMGFNVNTPQTFYDLCMFLK